jgi:transcriptional regulator with XRE-family HTH domain
MMISEKLSMMRGMKPDRTRIDPGSIPEISRRLRLLRKAVAVNQTELCAVTGITRAAWSNYENARDRIGVDAAMKICRTYGATLDWIYFGDPEFLRSGLRDRIRAVEHDEDAAPAKIA